MNCILCCAPAEAVYQGYSLCEKDLDRWFREEKGGAARPHTIYKRLEAEMDAILKEESSPTDT